MRKIKVTSKLKKILKKYHTLLEKAEQEYFQKVRILEEAMVLETKIENIEFFFCEGEYVGIGTPICPDKMRLVHREEL